MTNWHNPALERAEDLAFVKLIHVIVGVYIWEFVLNFDYEYSIINKRRKFKWTISLYLACRWSTLLAVIIYLLLLDKSNGIGCEASVIMGYIFYYFAFQSASCLVLLRVYALWERKRLVVILSLAVWLASNTAFIYTIATTRVNRDRSFCEVDHIVDTRIIVFSAFITDVMLLSLMLFGILRWKQASLTGGIWRLIYTQGLIYVVIATLAYTPTVAFLLLNLNEPMDSMFLVPSMIIMSVGALRMYRGLVDSAVLNNPSGGVICYYGAVSPPTPSRAPGLQKRGYT